MESIALLCLSGLLALAWLPILVKFFRNWRSRENPISLAICFVIAFAIYVSFIPFVRDPNPYTTMAAMEVVNLGTCVFFYISFGWAKRRWSPEDQNVRQTDYPANLSR